MKTKTKSKETQKTTQKPSKMKPISKKQILPVKFVVEPFFPRLDKLEASLMSTDPDSTWIVFGLGLVTFCARRRGGADC